MNTVDTLPSLSTIEKALHARFDDLEARRIPSVNSRLRALTHISVRQGERLLTGQYPRRLMGLAIADASYIALGARNALTIARVAPPEIPAAIKRSKPDLLALGGLGDPALRGLQRLFINMYGGDEAAIPTSALVVSTTPITSVAFTESTLVEINGCVELGRGCPAKGEIMERFFDRFVDTVLV